MKNRKNDNRKTARMIRVRRDEAGYAVEGPGFYVWDENLDAALAAAGDLWFGRFPVARVRRALLVPSARKPRTARRREIRRRPASLPLEG